MMPAKGVVGRGSRRDSASQERELAFRFAENCSDIQPNRARHLIHGLIANRPQTTWKALDARLAPRGRRLPPVDASASTAKSASLLAEQKRQSPHRDHEGNPNVVAR